MQFHGFTAAAGFRRTHPPQSLRYRGCLDSIGAFYENVVLVEVTEE
jgi:hypothetical protein